MPKYIQRSCRHCLGTGCYACKEGQVYSRVYSPADREAAALRRKLFGDTRGEFRPEARQQQERRTL